MPATIELGCYNEIDFQIGSVKVEEKKESVATVALYVIAKDRKGIKIDLDRVAFDPSLKKEEDKARNKVKKLVRLLNS